MFIDLFLSVIWVLCYISCYLFIVYSIIWLSVYYRFKKIHPITLDINIVSVNETIFLNHKFNFKCCYHIFNDEMLPVLFICLFFYTEHASTVYVCN